MSQETISKCDGCGATKGTVNHWWMVAEKLMHPANGDNPPVAGIVVIPWDERFVKQVKHYCGQACIQKAVSEFMGAK